MADLPHSVSGTVTDSKSGTPATSIVTFTTSQGSGVAVTNSSGQYVFDLANIGYTDGETVSYICEDQFKNEKIVSSFVVSGGTTTLNLTLAVRTDALPTRGARSFQIDSIGGKPISKDNPLPVIIVENLDK